MLAKTPIHTSIIIPTRNQTAMLIRLIDGLKATAEAFTDHLEVVIVNNQSDEPELSEFLAALERDADTSGFARVTVLPFDKKFNYSAINNLAVSHSCGKYLCFLNNDIEVIDRNWLAALHEPLSESDTGCVGAMLYYPDDTVQHAGVYLDAKDIAGHLYKYQSRQAKDQSSYLKTNQQVSAVTAACMLMPRRVFDAVGGFDEALSVAFNDVDLCLRVKNAGYNIIWTPSAELYHHESKSRGQSSQRSWWQKVNHKKEVLFMKKRWGNELSADPHHPDLKESQR